MRDSLATLSPFGVRAATGAAPTEFVRQLRGFDRAILNYLLILRYQRNPVFFINRVSAPQSYYNLFRITMIVSRN